MQTEIGPVQIEVPRDRDGSFEPQLVKKRQRRLSGIDEIVLSLTARGLTTGEIAAHFVEVYGATVSKDTISRITDKVVDEMTEWCHRPLDAVYPVIFIDAIHVKVRDGQVTNRAFYLAVGVTVDGRRDILGIWAGDGAEGGKYWLAVVTELKNRGVADVCIVVCDGLTAWASPSPAPSPERMTRCGRANCRCHADPPQLHGPYHQWTRKINGKNRHPHPHRRATRRLPALVRQPAPPPSTDHRTRNPQPTHRRQRPPLATLTRKIMWAKAA